MSDNLNSFRPMQGVPLPTGEVSDMESLDWSYGFWCSPKIDGIRAIKHPTLGLVTRTLKQVPNKYVQRILNDDRLNYFDGELVKGHWEEPVNFNTTQSALMSQEGEFHFSYCLFDLVKNRSDTFQKRNNELKELVDEFNFHSPTNLKFKIVHLEQFWAGSVDDVLLYESQCLRDGFEGIIVRDPRNQYKNGRSTWLQQGMIKLKRFVDAEAEIIGYEELYRNENEPIIDALGYQKRSAHLAGKVAANTLGKIHVVGINGEFKGVDFKIGSGFDNDLRDKIWFNKDRYLKKIVKYKYQKHGSKNKPRNPIFLGFVDDWIEYD